LFYEMTLRELSILADSLRQTVFLFILTFGN
jgi:hypothetical protein